MNAVVCNKEYSKMIRNIRFYNSCFKYDCGSRVDENMICSCCSVLSNAFRFIYNWHAMAKHNIKKILHFRFMLKSPAIIISFVRMSFVDSILFKCFPNSFTSPFVKFRIMFFRFFICSF